MKKKHLFLFFILVAMVIPSFAQNKIGDNPTVIHPASLLELESLTKGLRLPRVSLNDVSAWTLDGTATSGMIIFNESGSQPKGIYYWNTDLSKWIQVVSNSELSTLVANYLTQNQTVKDSIIKVVNNTITTGAIEGKDISSNSSMLKVTNGTGATLTDVQISIDSLALGHMLTSSPLKDSLAITISNNTVIRDSIRSVINNTITTGAIEGKDMSSNSSMLKVTNGTGATLTDVQISIDSLALGHMLTSSPLKDSIAVTISNNTVIRDSIKSVINNTITTGGIEGKNISSNSPVIKIANGEGATLSNVQISLDSLALGHLLTTQTLSDSLAVTISNNTVILDSIKSALTKKTTNQLALNNGNLISTVNGVSSSSVAVIASGDNGLTAMNGNVQLGGVLTKPTTLTASAINTLAINGLEEGDSDADSILVTAPNTGIIKKISTKSLSANVSKSVVLAINGQTTFATPAVIADIKKIQVYRNGISVEFTQVDGTHIQLDPEATCYSNDEIKIIQIL